MNSSFDLQSYFTKTNKSSEILNRSEKVLYIEVIYPSNETFVKSGFALLDNKLILTTESIRKTIYLEESILYYLVEREDCIIISISNNEKFYILKFLNKLEFNRLFSRIYCLIRKRNFSKYYEIRYKLGEGSYSKVYSCEKVGDEKLKSAVKIIKKSMFVSKPHHKVLIFLIKGCH